MPECPEAGTVQDRAKCILLLSPPAPFLRWSTITAEMTRGSCPATARPPAFTTWLFIAPAGSRHEL